MEENQIRRVVIVDKRGRYCGMMAQADLALEDSEEARANLTPHLIHSLDAAWVAGALPAAAARRLEEQHKRTHSDAPQSHLSAEELT